MKKHQFLLLFWHLLYGMIGLGSMSMYQANKPQLLENQFLSYAKIPTWTGLAADWQTQQPVLHLYDSERYRGHSIYVAEVLKGCKDFKEFKTLVSNPAQRKYLPFFLYDLRTLPINLQGQTYNWALLVEDYRFSDTNAQMLRLITRLAELIPQYNKDFHSKGIILLAKNLNNKVNQVLAPELIAKGYATMTLDGLCQKTGSYQQQILNKGTATGKLVMVNDDAEAEKLVATDIAIYNYIPLEVPPVAGIITLHPQTPLSHTAILAKNRGTVNVYVPNLRKLMGRYNQIGKVSTLQAIGKKVSLSPTGNQATATTLTTAIAPKITLPAASNALGLKVLAFTPTTDTALLCIENIGTKAANYARLQRLLGEQYVRQGFAIGYQPYFEVVAQQAQPYIEQLLTEKKQLDKAAIRQSLENIRQCIKESQVPQTTTQSLRQLMRQKYPYSRIRLRSSTNCEDLPQFNGAGLYDSDGLNGWESDKKINKAILKVYASLWNESAFWERDYFGIAHQQAAMALQINEAFDNDNELANGVLATEPTAKGMRILVNAQADHTLVTNPSAKGEMPESFYIVPQTGQIGQVNSRSSRSDVFLYQADRQYLVRQLAEVANKTHAYFVGKQPHYGIDVEFKVMCLPNGTWQLYVKQARLLRSK